MLRASHKTLVIIESSDREKHVGASESCWKEIKRRWLFNCVDNMIRRSRGGEAVAPPLPGVVSQLPSNVLQIHHLDDVFRWHQIMVTIGFWELISCWERLRLRKLRRFLDQGYRRPASIAVESRKHLWRCCRISRSQSLRKNLDRKMDFNLTSRLALSRERISSNTTEKSHHQQNLPFRLNFFTTAHSTPRPHQEAAIIITRMAIFVLFLDQTPLFSSSLKCCKKVELFISSKKNFLILRARLEGTHTAKKGFWIHKNCKWKQMKRLLCWRRLEVQSLGAKWILFVWSFKDFWKVFKGF